MGSHQIPTNYEHYLLSLGRVLQALREEENIDILIETTLNHLKSEFEYRLIWISIYDRMAHQLLGKGGFTPTGNINLLKKRFSLNPGDLLEQVVIQQKSIGIPDLRAEVRAGEWRQAAQELGIQGTMLFPLRHKDSCFGVVLLGSHLWGVSPRTSEKSHLSLLFGELAHTLCQIELNQQRSSIKHSDEPLFELIGQMRKLSTLEERLQAVVKISDEFIGVTRTNVYWYHAEGRYFWLKASSQHKGKNLSNPTSSAGLNVQELNDFYYSLATDQLIAIGAGKSPLGSEATRILLSRLRTRSVLAAPIIVQKELLGFLAVEGNEARIWEETEKKYIRAVAQLIAVVTTDAEIARQSQQIHAQTNLVAEITNVIAENTTNPNKALEKSVKLLLEFLNAERFLLLKPENEQETEFPRPYSLVYQHQQNNLSPLPVNLSPLNKNDYQLIFSAEKSVIGIENWQEDKRLTSWRDLLLPLGVQSVMIGDTSKAYKSGVIMIGAQISRTWRQTEYQLINIVSQQFGQLLQAIALQITIKVELEAHQTLESGLKTLLSAPRDQTEFKRIFTELLAKILTSPVGVLLTWSPRAAKAIVATTVIAEDSFSLPKKLSIPITDTLLQEIIAAEGFLSCSIHDISPKIRDWLSSTGVDMLLVIAVHDRKHPASGILLLGYRPQDRWQSHLLPVAEILVQQFANLRHYRRLNAVAINEVRQLEQLNWYKHRCLEHFYSTVEINVERMIEFNQVDPQFTDLALLRMRSSQILRHLESTLDTFLPVLNQEKWDLTLSLDSLSIGNLIKRSLHNIESVTDKRKIVINIHNPENLNVYADKLKLECVLQELLITACEETNSGGTIDIWCQSYIELPNLDTKLAVGENPESVTLNQGSAPQSFVELLITNQGKIEDNFFIISEVDHSNDIPMSLPLNPKPSNINLNICQRILRSWGGNLLFYKLENNHFINRLLMVNG